MKIGFEWAKDENGTWKFEAIRTYTRKKKKTLESKRSNFVFHTYF